MKEHIRVYLDYFGYGIDDYIPCEIPGCNNRAGPPHHIDPRGLGGSEERDNIENLIGLCMYPHHEEAEKHLLSKEYLKFVHLDFMSKNKVI